MNMAESADDSRPNEMTISVKTPKEKHDIQICVNASVKELKDEVAKQFGTPIEQLCLIFAGKILKDPDTLEQLGINHGLTVHLVIKTTSRPAEPALPSATLTAGLAQPDVSQSPFGLGSLGGLAGISGLGMGSANFMDMQQRMERELMGNPAMLRQMMENPFVQQMMSSPDVMRQLLMNNPQMRDLMERNPEISHMLNNPDLMRQTMELARNPAMLQELMRSQDRAMSNLESLPGGFNALQRMYRDIQEPMMSAAQDSLGSNPFASLANSGSGAGGVQQGRENRDPLPNPWGPTSGTTGTATTSGSSSTTTSNPSQAQDRTWPNASPFTSNMQSMVQQMMQNPQMMQNMMQAPYMQSILENMSTDPQLARQVLSNNPMFADNPALLERFQDQLPTITSQLNNPDVHSAMSNPRALEAMMEIHDGMIILESEAPEVFRGLSGLQGVMARAAATTTTTTSSSSVPPSNTSTSDSATTNPTTTTTSSTSTSTSPATTGAAGTTPGTGQGTGQEVFPNVMSQLMGLMMMGGGQQAVNQPPEQRYASQLEQLATMGFVDREANIRALTATLGDVNAAIDRLFHQR